MAEEILKEIKTYLKNELENIKKNIDTIIDEKLSKLQKEQIKKLSKKEEKFEKEIIKPEIAILLSLIELLKEKEIFTEDELDKKLEQIDPEVYRKLKEQYEIFHTFSEDKQKK
ncbi:MAG: hypothetical protein QXD62_03200 [Candidatus Woesearchaeota archaeon]